MSVKKRPDPGHWAVQGAFLVGLALIVLATIHNVGFDGMTQAERLTLPAYLATYGKFGVTLLLVALGVGVILLGFLIQYLCGSSGRGATWSAPRHLRPSPSWAADGSNGSTVGRVQLATQKYLDRDERDDF